jgi:HSP20 family protein
MAEKNEEKESRTPARWDPFGELFALERGWPFRELGSSRLSRMLDDFFGERARGRGHMPALDIREDDSQFTVTVELPGVAKDDVTVEVDEGVLCVRGEKKSEREEKKGKERWTERSYGSFSRSFTLPPSADGDRIEASFKDGLLTLVLPKKEAAKAKQVSIKS